jgi:hypothetical protein
MALIASHRTENACEFSERPGESANQIELSRTRSPPLVKIRETVAVQAVAAFLSAEDRNRSRTRSGIEQRRAESGLNPYQPYGFLGILSRNSGVAIEVARSAI